MLIQLAYHNTHDHSSTTYNAMIHIDCTHLFHWFRQPQRLFKTGLETSTIE